MALTQKRLAGPAQLTATSAVYYTVPLSTTTIVKQIILTNTTASAKTVTVRLKPLGVTEAATHDIVSAMSLAANETMSFNCSLVLNNNGSTANATNSDQLTALCSSTTSVNITVVGVEEA
jgi:hypothetical protein